MSAVSIPRVYRSFLRVASQFPDYNFRSYACRRIRSEFQSTPKTDYSQPYVDSQLDLLRRQVTLGKMFPSGGKDKHVFEEVIRRRKLGQPVV